MVTKSKNRGEKQGRVKVGQLKFSKQTVRELTRGETRQIKGGLDDKRNRDDKGNDRDDKGN